MMDIKDFINECKNMGYCIQFKQLRQQDPELYKAIMREYKTKENFCKSIEIEFDKQKKYSIEQIKKELKAFSEDCRCNNRIPFYEEFRDKHKRIHYFILKKYGSVKKFCDENDLNDLYNMKVSKQKQSSKILRQKEKSILKRVVKLNDKRFISFNNKSQLVKSPELFNITELLEKHGIIRLPEQALRLLIKIDKGISEIEAKKAINADGRLKSWLYYRYKSDVLRKFKEEFL